MIAAWGLMFVFGVTGVVTCPAHSAHLEAEQGVDHETSGCCLWIGDIRVSWINHEKMLALAAMRSVGLPGSEPSSKNPRPTALQEIGRARAIVVPDQLPIRNQIHRQVAYYQDHQGHLDRSIDRAMPILPLIVAKLRAAGLPVELALLPIMESSYHPDALSSAQAAGLWQITPATGRSLGLDRSSVFDGRMDIEQSTDAAIAYLTRLHAMFGNDWTKTLMAYNGGEGTLRQVLSGKIKPTDEMRQYPIRFYALVSVLRQAGLDDMTASNRSSSEKSVKKIALNGTISLPKIAELTGVDAQDLYDLNAGYRTGLTLGGHDLLVPGDLAHAFTQARLKVAEHAAARWHLARIKRKKPIAEIAREHHCSSDELLAMNRIDVRIVSRGAELLVP